MDEFESLVAEPRRKRGRPSNAELAARRESATSELNHQAELRKAAQGHQSLGLDQFGDPVPQNFLARLMRMDPQTVNQRLAKCRPAAIVGTRKVYYFHEAIHYLVKPKMTAEEFARTLNKADLPPEINKSFWDSQRSRVKYKIEAQEAWETEDVMQALGEVSMIFNDSLVSVVEEMRDRAKLTDEQTEILSAAIDEFRSEVREKLIDLPKQKFTGSMFAKPMFGIAEQPDGDPDIPAWDEDDGDFDD
ncbi:DUF1441 family protein [Novosphingobium resinovorum]|uniref:Terminase small subunit n=1 Tax=Novosphingobium resinovorum TaxID=158500 RepID=A0A1D8A3E4_9SPHN|nr:DUF1441 family protein [Novosphingobium resinovorum]AOR76582.1 hypothetical protein BES08_07335 [Novosphingobium resinovorum]